MEHKKRKPTSKRSNDTSSPLFLLRQGLFAALTSLLILLPLTLVCAWICYRTGDPLALTSAVGTGLGFTAYLLAGILCARKLPDTPMITALTAALILSLLFFLGGWLFEDESSSFLKSCLLKLLGAGFSVIGAYLASLRKKSSRRGKRRSHGRN